jgi:hypothetical protein
MYKKLQKIIESTLITFWKIKIALTESRRSYFYIIYFTFLCLLSSGDLISCSSTIIRGAALESGWGRGENNSFSS